MNKDSWIADATEHASGMIEWRATAFGVSTSVLVPATDGYHYGEAIDSPDGWGVRIVDEAGAVKAVAYQRDNRRPVAVEQLEFPDLTPSPAGTALLTIDQRFARFHRDNPHVYDALVTRALGLVAQGHKRVSVGMLFEVLRYSAMRTRGDDSYKLNNDFRSRYARMMVDNVPELVDAIELRKLTS